MKLQLKTRQVCLFIIAFLPITKLFIVPSILATSASEDAWISATLSLALDFITLLFILNACKKAKISKNLRKNASIYLLENSESYIL